MKRNKFPTMAELEEVKERLQEIESAISHAEQNIAVQEHIAADAAGRLKDMVGTDDVDEVEKILDELRATTTNGWAAVSESINQFVDEYGDKL